MIVGIEETTDSRYPQTKIAKFRSETAARKWLSRGGGYAWPAAADPTLPVGQQNFHHRLREAYVMPPHFRLSPKEVEAERSHHRPDSLAQRQARVYRRHATDQLHRGLA